MGRIGIRHHDELQRVVEKINQGLIPGYKPPFSKNFLVLKRELISEIMNGSQYSTNKMLENNVKNSIDLRRYSNTWYNKSIAVFKAFNKPNLLFEAQTILNTF